MRRNLSWLPLVVLAFSAGGTIALAQPQRGMPDMGGMMQQNSGTCSSCKKVVTWTGKIAPSSCPHCRVKIDYVEGADGSKTTPSGGKFTNGGMYVGIGIAVIGLIVFAVSKISQSGNSRPKRSKKRRKPRRRETENE